MNIDELGKSWGKHMRSTPNGWSRTNFIARMGDIKNDHNYVRDAYSSDSITSSTQRAYPPTTKTGALKFGTDNWHISGSGPATDGSEYHRNCFDMRIINMRIAKHKILITEFMDENALWFHRAWRKLSFGDQAMLWTHYVATVSIDRKCALLSASSQDYAAWLKRSQRAVETKKGMLQLSAPIHKPATRTTKKKEQIAPSWTCRIFASIHKFPIRDSNPPTEIFIGEPDADDEFCYFRRDDGELYAVLRSKAVKRLRRRDELDSFLSDRKQKPETLCHFPGFVTKLDAKDKLNTQDQLHQRGLTNLDQCLAHWCQELREHPAIGRRTQDGCYPI